ncbi:MAG TPA: DUF302 domain-containing protein [Aliiroseovarius sp.]|nr:DUF302 domain-containing protein [Aliiroseovarius sp.]
MTFIRNLLAVLGLLAVLAVLAVLFTFRDFDPKAGGVYWNMAKRLAETGNSADATVWKRKVADGLTFEEVDETIQSVALSENIRDVGQLPLGDQVGLMQGEDWRKLKIYLYCNPLTAAKMVEYSEAFSAYLPCRVALVEDDAGDLWVYSLDMDMMIHGGKPLPPELLEEALHVKEVILAILDGAEEGAF